MSAPQRSRAVDVAVVGGGVIGLSIAWRLACRRALSVAVYDARRRARWRILARGRRHARAPRSRRSTGPAGRQRPAGSDSRRWPAGRRSRRKHRAGRFGVDVGLRTTGTLVLGLRDRDEAEALEREIAFRQSLGAAARATRLLGSEGASAGARARAGRCASALHAPSDQQRGSAAGRGRASLAQRWRRGATLAPWLWCRRACGSLSASARACTRRACARPEDGVRVASVHPEGVRLEGVRPRRWRNERCRCRARGAGGRCLVGRRPRGFWGAAQHAGAAAQAAVSTVPVSAWSRARPCACATPTWPGSVRPCRSASTAATSVPRRPGRSLRPRRHGRGARLRHDRDRRWRARAAARRLARSLPGRRASSSSRRSRSACAPDAPGQPADRGSRGAGRPWQSSTTGHPPQRDPARAADRRRSWPPTLTKSARVADQRGQDALADLRSLRNATASDVPLIASSRLQEALAV